MVSELSVISETSASILLSLCLFDEMRLLAVQSPTNKGKKIVCSSDDEEEMPAANPPRSPAKDIAGPSKKVRTLILFSFLQDINDEGEIRRSLHWPN